MKALLFAATVLFVVGSAVCFAPPNLPQQFTTNFTISFTPDGAPSFFEGLLAFDYVNGALHLEVDSQECKRRLQKQGVMIGYWFAGPMCWFFDPTPLSFISDFPFQIPSDAAFLGSQTINGELCTGWSFTIDVSAVQQSDSPVIPINMWVSSTTGNIVQVSAKLSVYGRVYINFFDTVPGPFSSSLLTIPNKYCQSLP